MSNTTFTNILPAPPLAVPNRTHDAVLHVLSIDEITLLLNALQEGRYLYWFDMGCAIKSVLDARAERDAALASAHKATALLADVLHALNNTTPDPRQYLAAVSAVLADKKE